MKRSFIDFLREQREGKTEDELATALNTLVATVERTGKGGKLVFTVSVNPVNKEMSGQLIVSDSIDLKLPKPKRSPSLFFSTPENNLVRKDPRQGDLPLKTVESVPAVLKQVDSEAVNG